MSAQVYVAAVFLGLTNIQVLNLELGVVVDQCRVWGQAACYWVNQQQALLAA
jgi:hypothetical protein